MQRAICLDGRTVAPGRGLQLNGPNMAIMADQCHGRQVIGWQEVGVAVRQQPCETQHHARMLDHQKKTSEVGTVRWEMIPAKT